MAATMATLRLRPIAVSSCGVNIDNGAPQSCNENHGARRSPRPACCPATARTRRCRHCCCSSTRQPDTRWPRGYRRGRWQPRGPWGRRVHPSRTRCPAAPPARDQHQRGAHAFRLGQAIAHAVPVAELAQRCGGILARRHAVGLAHRQPTALAERPGNCARLARIHAQPAAGRGDQHQGIAEQVVTLRRQHQAALLQIVHPFQVGRKNTSAGAPCSIWRASAELAA